MRYYLISKNSLVRGVEAMIKWYGDKDLEHRSLIKDIVNFVAKREKINVTIVYSDDERVKGPFAQSAKGNSKRAVIYIPHGGSMNEIWQGNQGLSTLSRMRVRITKNSDLPHEMKYLLVLLSDILHEMGHIKFQYDPRRGRSLNDVDRYQNDLEYRLKTENEAEQLVTKWFKHFGFYHFINDVTKLD